MRKLKPYPCWVCQSCGSKASGGRQFEISCWHKEKCDVCGKVKPVTEARDFFYPNFKGHNNRVSKYKSLKDVK